jgi:import receptor subunit TOM20
VEFLKNENRVSPLLVARFVARQVTSELQKLIDATTPTKKINVVEDDFTNSDSTDYGLVDHIDRLRYLDIAPDKKEIALLSDVLQTALPGLGGFVPEERYTILSGRMTYNAFGVSYNGGRDNRVRCRANLPF